MHAHLCLCWALIHRCTILLPSGQDVIRDRCSMWWQEIDAEFDMSELEKQAEEASQR